MKVIFLANVPKIGNKGEEKEVKPGFARNFLFPKKLAVSVESSEGLKIIEERSSEEEKQQSAIQKVKEAIDKNSGTLITFKEKASAEGKLFGSVKISEIEKEITKRVGIKPERIEPGVPIKEIGEHQFSAKYSAGDALGFTVKVIAEKN